MTPRLPQGALILIDTNLAILLCVGLSGRNNIAKHKRLAQFDSIDFDLLQDFLSPAANIVFSPYVLGETSNLVRQIGNPLKHELTAILRSVVLNASELQTESASIVNNSHYMLLGITDAALLSVLETYPGVVLLTVDLDLYLAAASRGFEAINFTHIRDQRPDIR